MYTISMVGIPPARTEETTMYRTRYHRDGTVTVWDVYLQQWTRRSAASLVAEAQAPAPNAILPTLSETERARIGRIAARA